MIPIDRELVLKNTKAYDLWFTELKKRFEAFSKNGYVGNKKNDLVTDPFNDDKTGNTSKFFSCLSKGGLKKLVYAEAISLIDVIDFIEDKFPQIKDHESILYKNVYHAFVKLGYDKIDKGKFINSIGILCCPYCNRVYIHSVKSGSKKVKGEIDHFYDKDRYPYLAISLFNLIPSCSFCNGASGKHDKDSNSKDSKIVNPYLITDEEVKFTFDIIDVEKYYSNKQGAINVELDISTRLSVNDTIFHLRDLYATHDDHAMELIFKSQIKYPLSYRKFLETAFNNLNLTKDEIDRLIIGNYANKADFHKRPLSKMYYDIAQELNLIDK